MPLAIGECRNCVSTATATYRERYGRHRPYGLIRFQLASRGVASVALELHEVANHSRLLGGFDYGMGLQRRRRKRRSSVRSATSRRPSATVNLTSSSFTESPSDSACAARASAASRLAGPATPQTFDHRTVACSARWEGRCSKCIDALSAMGEVPSSGERGTGLNGPRLLAVPRIIAR